MGSSSLRKYLSRNPFQPKLQITASHLMAANWPARRAARRALAFEALKRLRIRVAAAGGRAVRLLIHGPVVAPTCTDHEALVQFIAQGGTYDEYMATAMGPRVRPADARSRR
jgi:hypothetical protein